MYFHLHDHNLQCLHHFLYHVLRSDHQQHLESPTRNPTIILLLNLLKSRWCMVFSFIPSPTRLLQVRRKCFDRSLKCFPHVVPMLLHPPHKVLSRADNCFTKPSPHLPCTHLVNMRHSLMINTFFRAEVRKFIILHNGPNAMGL